MSKGEIIEVAAIVEEVLQGAMEEAMEMAMVVAMEVGNCPTAQLENNTKEVNILIQVS